MTDNDHTNQTGPAGWKTGAQKAVLGRADKIHPVRNTEQNQRKSRGGGGSRGKPQVAVVPFDFEGKSVRTVTKASGIWFAATDACAVLDIGNVTDVVNRLDDDEKGVDTIETPGGPQQLNIVSESGLYSLIFTSRKPEAKAFRRWVTGVVLPTLRQTGTFDMRRQSDRSTSATELVDGQEIAITLPGPGRYLVVLFHNGEQRIEPLCFSDVVSALAALDCRSIAYSHLTAASLWEKLQHIRTGRADVSGGFTSDKLNATMQAGADLARQILYTYDEPMLNPRPAANSTRD